jgi:prolyl-tRNA editing enzyme YbaK/EbsC (Cys-tRNA(Pro) deacylase)
MPAAPNVIAALDAAGVAYEVMPCDPDLADTAVFCEAYGIPPERSANAILVASRRPLGERAVCVVLATSRLDVNRTVRQRLGVKKASFASADETAEATGMSIGGVTPLGLPNGLPVWIDAAVMIPDWVIVGAGTRTAKIRLAPEDLVRAAAAEVIEGLARPVEAIST